ncbi:ferredoxin [Streptomyces humi]|uniref:ferredoxin n=1 Tax=Streptomyces humi TaxID=1428620 RepID=UPI0006287198|nr:ferredoxin [Streptomyces humi]
MRVSVDADVCYGSGECAFRAPAVFGFADGYGFVLPGRAENGTDAGTGRDGEPGQDAGSGRDGESVDDELLRDIAERCPSQAIRIDGKRVTD